MRSLGIEITPSWDFELIMVSHSRQTAPRSSLPELKNLRFILFRKGSRLQDPIDHYFAANGFVPNVTMRFDNAEFVRSMVRAGLGVSLLPMWVVDRDLKERRLNLVRHSGPPLYSKIALVRRKSAYVPQSVQAFISIARSLEARQLPLLTKTRLSSTIHEK